MIILYVYRHYVFIEKGIGCWLFVLIRAVVKKSVFSFKNQEPNFQQPTTDFLLRNCYWWALFKKVHIVVLG
jgi:hypothetical protein